MNSQKTSRKIYILLLTISISFLIIALIHQSPLEILEGYINILKNPSNLLTDYMVIGGIGAAFFNAFTILMYTTIITRLVKKTISGAELAAILLVTGFAFFGTNIVNSLPLTMGVFLFSKIDSSSYENVIIPSLYITALGPLISELMFTFNYNIIIGLFLSYSVGIIIGFITTPLAASFLRFHQGYNLYNIGFTAGIIGMLIVGLLRTFNMEIETVSKLYEGDDIIAKTYIILFSIILIFVGWYKNDRSFYKLGELINKPGRLPSDYVFSDGLYLSMINMGFTGLISSFFVIISKGIFNGPVIGGIFSVIAFSAFGKNIKNIIPIFLGVYIAGLLNIHEPSSTSAILAGLFGTTLAPIAGEYGFSSGILAGFLHMSMVFNIGIVHGGMNLYNNGFSGGFIAGILVPLLNEFRRIKYRRRSDNER